MPCFHVNITLTGRECANAGVKFELSVKKWHADENKRTYGVPVFRCIFTGGQVDKANSAHIAGGSKRPQEGDSQRVHEGDSLVMITAPNGRVVDFRRWAQPRPPPKTSKPPPKDTSRVVSQLGPWRECAVDAGVALDDG